MISTITDGGAVGFEPVGYLRQLLDSASPEDRDKYEAHIIRYLARLPKDLMQSMGTEEALEDIRDPEGASKRASDYADFVDKVVYASRDAHSDLTEPTFVPLAELTRRRKEGRKRLTEDELPPISLLNEYRKDGTHISEPSASDFELR